MVWLLLPFDVSRWRSLPWLRVRRRPRAPRWPPRCLHPPWWCAWRGRRRTPPSLSLTSTAAPPETTPTDRTESRRIKKTYQISINAPPGATRRRSHGETRGRDRKRAHCLRSSTITRELEHHASDFLLCGSALCLRLAGGATVSSSTDPRLCPSHLSPINVTSHFKLPAKTNTADIGL